jgi:hypothetical protein
MCTKDIYSTTLIKVKSIEMQLMHKMLTTSYLIIKLKVLSFKRFDFIYYAICMWQDEKSIKIFLISGNCKNWYCIG